MPNGTIEFPPGTHTIDSSATITADNALDAAGAVNCCYCDVCMRLRRAYVNELCVSELYDMEPEPEPEPLTGLYNVTVQGRHKLAPKYTRTYQVRIYLNNNEASNRLDAEDTAIQMAYTDGFIRNQGRSVNDPYALRVVSSGQVDPDPAVLV